jgi:hypothetical protein
MSLLRFFRKSQRPVASRRRAPRKARPFIESLENRVVPTILWTPASTPPVASNGGGGVLGQDSPGVPIHLIFWGSYWATSAGATLAAQSEYAMTAGFYNTAYLDGLHEYGTVYRAFASSDHPSVFDYSDSPSSVSSSDIANEVQYAIDNLGVPESDAYSNEPVYFVITAPGVSSPGALAFHDLDHDYDFPFDYDEIVYGWSSNVGTLDTYYGIMANLSHELAEAMTDPRLNGWTTTADEICDGEALNYAYRMNGYLMQSYWSQSHGAFEVTDGNAQNFTFTGPYVSNANSFDGGVLNLYGDQFGSGWNDTISIDTSGGGMTVTMNGETATFDPGFVTKINVYTGGGSNTVNVYNTTVPVNIQGGGSDTVNIGNNYDGLQGITADVTVTNPPNYTTLNINDGADWIGRTGYVTNGYVWGLSSGTIYFNQADLSALNVYGGSGGNTFYVTSTPTNGHGVSNYLNSGSWYNTVNVEGTNNSLTVDGGSGVQYVYVGSNGSALGGTLANIHGSLFVENSNTSGYSYLYADDGGDSTGQTWTLNFDQITSTGMPGTIGWNTYGSGYGGVPYLQVRGGSGFNTMNVNSTGSTPWSYFTDVYTGTGGATVNVRSTLGNLDVINQGGQDYVYVGSDGTASDSTMANIKGWVDVYGSGPSYLYLGDAGDTTGRTVNLYDGEVTGLSPGNIYWTPSPTSTGGGVTYLDVLGSGGGSTYNVQGTSNFYWYTFLQTGGGNDAVNVKATTGNLYAYNSGGTDTVVVGSNAPSTSGGTLANIHGWVYVYGAGSTALVVDDSGDAAVRTATLTSGQLSGLSAQPVYYGSGVTSLTVNGGSAADTYNVESTQAGTATTVNGGAANDTFTVSAAAKNLDGIAGPLTLNGGGGTANAITLNDQNSGVAHTYTLNGDTSLARTGAATISYSGVKTVTVNGGSGGNAFVVAAAPATTTATLNGGTGANTLTGPNAAETWTINGANKGTLGAKVPFTAMKNLVGGSLNDIFKFTGAGSVSGTVTGGGGTANKLDYSALAVAITVNLQTASAPLINDGGAGGFSNIQAVTGTTSTGNTLIGPNADTNWTVSSANGGKAGGVTFLKFQNLVGGSGVDVFKFTALGSLAGTLDGGAAPLQKGNWLDYTGLAAAVTVNLATGAATGVAGGAAGKVANIQNVHGGNGGNTLTGNAQGNILIGGTGADTIVGGSGRSLLIGDKGSDSVTGKSSNDILIGGLTKFDAMTAANESALMAILAEWQSADSYADRFGDLNQGAAHAGGSHLNGASLLKTGAGATVLDDSGAADTLTEAGAGTRQDWFFQYAGDSLNNQPGEHVNNT